jgi:hypothetical protein
MAKKPSSTEQKTPAEKDYGKPRPMGPQPQPQPARQPASGWPGAEPKTPAWQQPDPNARRERPDQGQPGAARNEGAGGERRGEIKSLEEDDVVLDRDWTPPDSRARPRGPRPESP